MAPDSLTEILDRVWTSLQEGRAHGRHPFHTPTVATLRDDRPEARVVVLRSVDPDAGTLSFHTDARSPKTDDLADHQGMAWLFYDKSGKTQLRVRGPARIHRDDALTVERWSRMRPFSRRCYFQEEAPGDPVDGPGSTLPDPSAEVLQDHGSHDEARSRLCVVECRAEEIDWLHLRAQGHIRARFVRDGDGWAGSWIAP